MREEKLQTKAIPADKITPTQQSSDEEDPSKWSSRSSRRSRRRGRLIIISGSLAAAAVLVGAVFLILAFTVYKIREPTMKVDAITVQRRDGRGGSGSLFESIFGNSTVEIAASVKNPNPVTYYYDKSVTSFYYKGTLLTEAPGPSGKAAAGRTYKLNVTVEVSNFKLDDSLVEKALQEGVADVDASTMIDGHVKILGLVRHRVDVLLNCTVSLAVVDLKIVNQSCVQHVWT